MYVIAHNSYDAYYNSQFQINNAIKYHHEYLEVTDEIKNYNEFYLNYLKDRDKIINIILKKRNVSLIDESGMYNVFKEEIFVDIFHELKKLWGNLQIVYFKNDEININHDKSFIHFNNPPVPMCEIINEIYWGGIIRIPNVSDFFNKKLDNNEKFMICRIGNVELDIINQYKYNKKDLTTLFNKYRDLLCKHDSDEIFSIKDNTSTSHKLTYDLLRVSTNAGFYITDKDNNFNVLESFINNYLEAYRNCDGLFRYDACLNRQIDMKDIIKTCYTVYAEKDIYNLIKDKKILIISPFATQINNQIKNGNMQKLFKKQIKIIPKSDRDIDNNICGYSEEYELLIYTDITSIETPITIFGNPVNDSWKDTFDKTCLKIKDYCDNNKVDIVIASCGCYSMPICNYVYKQLNISSLCYGNAIHQLFGIMQNDFYLFPKENINEEYWINVDESVICNERLMENLKKIDITGGKYLKN